MVRNEKPIARPRATARARPAVALVTLGGTLLTLALLTLVLLLAHATPAAAQLPPRDQMDPNITFLSDRQELLLVWSEDRGSGNLIYAKRVRANGLPVGGSGGGEWEATRLPPMRYGSPPPIKGDQRWPAVMEGLLVYSERVPGGADYDLYGQRLYSNGRPNGVPMLISGGPGDQVHPDVTRLDRGNRGGEFLVVWSEDTRDAGDVMGIRVDFALRRSRGPAFPVAKGPGTAEDPSIARDLLDQDSYLVLFTDDRSGNKDILGTRLTESGLPRGGPLGGHFPVIDSPEDDYAPEIVTSIEELSLGPTPTPERIRRPRETYRARNLLIWTTDHVTDGPNVMAHRLSNNGLPTGSTFLVAGGSGAQSWPAAALVSLKEGRPGAPREQRDEWLAVWTDNSLGTLDVVSSRVGLNGIARSTRRVLASD